MASGGPIASRLTAPLLLALFATPARAAGPSLLDVERTINTESPQVLAPWRWRFDLLHSWSNGETFSERIPIADFHLALGLPGSVQIRVEGLFHNKDFWYPSGTTRKKAVFHFNAFEYELQWRLLHQREGVPLSLAVAGVYMKDNFRWSVENFEYSDANRIPGMKLIAQRDSRNWGHYLAWKWMQIRSEVGAGRMILSGVTLGERFKVVRTEKSQIDLVGDYGILTVQQKRYHKARDPWGAGVQTQLNPSQTLTLFISNTVGMNQADSLYGFPDRFYSFRWSYRF